MLKPKWDICMKEGCVPQNSAQALFWYRKAAAQNYTLAFRNIGAMYEYGKGAPKDYQQAVHWYRKAAEQGDIDAQAFLGLMYENGYGIPQSRMEAIRLYSKVAREGSALAKTYLENLTRATAINSLDRIFEGSSDDEARREDLNAQRQRLRQEEIGERAERKRQQRIREERGY